MYAAAVETAMADAPTTSVRSDGGAAAEEADVMGGETVDDLTWGVGEAAVEAVGVAAVGVERPAPELPHRAAIASSSASTGGSEDEDFNDGEDDQRRVLLRVKEPGEGEGETREGVTRSRRSCIFSVRANARVE
jgi:hypothetical protein